MPPPSLTPAASPVPTPVCPPCGTLRVSVRELDLPGTIPGTPALTPVPTDTPHPFTQAPVFVRATAAWDRSRVVAEELIDARGTIQFALPPGDYWVFLPLDGPQPLRGFVSPAESMPDIGTVYAWQEVAVRANDSIDVKLTFEYPEA
jgi:hypothetical protein